MNGRGNGRDDEDGTPEPIDLDRTPADGIAAKGSSRTANIRLAVSAATQHLRRAVRDGRQLAQLLAAADGCFTDEALRELADKGRAVAGAFLVFSRDLDEARKRRGVG